MNNLPCDTKEKHKVTFNDFLTLLNEDTSDGIEFENCFFEEPFKLPIEFVCKRSVLFTGCVFSTIFLQHCSFTQEIHFYNCRVTEDLTILQCSFEGEFLIET